MIALLVFSRGGPVLAPIAAALAIFVMIGTLSEVFIRVLRGGAKVDRILARARGLPLSFWGGALAHLGVGVTLLGLAATGFGSEVVVSMKAGAPVEVGPYSLVIDVVGQRSGPNYREVVAHMTIRRDGAAVATTEPARREFSTRQMATTRSGDRHLGLRPGLCFDRRSREGRHDPGAALLEAPRHLHLARRADDGVRRRRYRSPTAGCASARLSGRRLRRRRRLRRGKKR